jgi:hypothetical protein
LRDETTLTPTTVYVEPLAVSSLSDEPDRVSAVFAEVLNSLPYYNDRAKSAELAKYVGLSSLSDREFYQPNPNSSSNEVFGTRRQCTRQTICIGRLDFMFRKNYLISPSAFIASWTLGRAATRST